MDEPVPATRDRPRFVTLETVSVFEKVNPALAGIGKLMIDEGIWVVIDNDARSETVSARAKARTRDSTRMIYANKSISIPI